MEEYKAISATKSSEPPKEEVPPTPPPAEPEPINDLDDESQRIDELRQQTLHNIEQKRQREAAEHMRNPTAAQKEAEKQADEGHGQLFKGQIDAIDRYSDTREEFKKDYKQASRWIYNNLYKNVADNVANDPHVKEEVEKDLKYISSVWDTEMSQEARRNILTDIATGKFVWQNYKKPE
jgi:hypothetical protein